MKRKPTKAEQDYAAKDARTRAFDASLARWLRKARRMFGARTLDARDAASWALARDVWRTIDPEGYRKAVKRG